ncbi:IS1479 transposase [Xanthomonas bromi]|uniref:IS1479 transposase n=1 Tax=Xanthomonas bromi TaxID=56449 RepID=A0A1C3NIM1_9XANT|nr:IS1479 transposase [Xanthomonas bromi]
MYDTVSMRSFSKIDCLDEVPDETTVLNFRHVLKRHDLARRLLHGKEDTVCSDGGYTGLDKREEMKW